MSWLQELLPAAFTLTSLHLSYMYILGQCYRNKNLGLYWQILVKTVYDIPV